ncbi:MAG TPA: hypothetical protein VGE68_07485 [Sphingomicrobium sp.]
MIRAWLLPALLLASCGPKTLTLPEQPVDRAATCGVVAAAEARAATTNIKAPLPFEAMGRILHYPLLAGSEGGSFSADTATAVQKRMTELQDKVTGGKWQQLAPACRAAFPATATEEVKLPPDRFEAQLGCYELGEFIRSALEKQVSYDNDLGAYRELRDTLDTSIGTGLRSRVGGKLEAQQEARHKALATIANAGPPAAVMTQCIKRFGAGGK